MRFVDPSQLVIRLRNETERIVEHVAERGLDPVGAQPEISRRLNQLGTLIIKSLDRNDRDVAAEGAWGSR